MLLKGEKAPLFTIQASLDGKEVDFSLQEALKEGPVVVYFYPASYTEGCDIQAHEFASYIAEFTKAKTAIIGISADKIDKLNVFSADPEFCAGEFPVGSDADGEIAAQFGLEMMDARPGTTDIKGEEIKHRLLPRTTFIIDTDGTIIATFSSEKDGISPTEHVTKALQVVENL